MYRTIYYLGLVVAIASLLGLVVPRSLSSPTFLLPSSFYAVAGILFASILMYFAVASKLRKSGYKIGLGIGGGLLLIFSSIGIFDPTYFGITTKYMRPANDLMLLLSAIGFLIAALEYNRPSLAEELGFDRIGKMYREYTWKLILGLKVSRLKGDDLTGNQSKAH